MFSNFKTIIFSHFSCFCPFEKLVKHKYIVLDNTGTIPCERTVTIFEQNSFRTIRQRRVDISKQVLLLFQIKNIIYNLFLLVVPVDSRVFEEVNSVIARPSETSVGRSSVTPFVVGDDVLQVVVPRLQ